MGNDSSTTANINNQTATTNNTAKTNNTAESNKTITTTINTDPIVNSLKFSLKNQEKDTIITVYKKRNGECQICNKNETLVNISINCNHEPSYCLECLKQSFEVKIKDKGICHFQCYQPKCNIWFENQEYIYLLDDVSTNIVSKLLLNEMLESNEEFRYCKNPNGCGAGQLISNWKDLKGYYTCHTCGHELCFRHRLPWHKGHTCEEFDKNLELNPDLSTDSLILQFTQKCPKCKNDIEKLEGCSVMTCCRYGTHGCKDNRNYSHECRHGGSYCGTIFCWKCLGVIQEIQKGGYLRNCKADCPFAGL